MHPTSSTPTAKDSSDLKIACALALLMLAVYLTVTGLHFISNDEIDTFVVARNLVGHGSFDTDNIAWLGPTLMGNAPATVVGVDGHSYTIKEVGTSILAVPFLWMGKLIGASPVRAAFLATPVLTAITVAVFYLLIRQMGYSRPTATLGALIYGLASPALLYAQTLYTQPAAAFGLLIALWGVISARASRSWRPALLGGLGIGFAGINALPTWITLPFHVLCLIPWETLPASPRKLLSRNTLLLGLAFGTGTGLFVLAQGIYNFLRFGFFLQTGHQQGGVLDLSPAYFSMGSVGLLLSTPRGLAWCMPVAILAPLGIVMAIRQRRSIGPLCLAAFQFVAVLVFYSCFRYWMTGGPRYLVPVMPALVLLIVPWLDYMLVSRARLGRLVTGIIILLSMLPQFLGSMLDFGPEEHLRLSGAYSIPMPPEKFFSVDPALMDVGVSLQGWALHLIEQGKWNTVWMSQGSLDWLVFGPLIALIMLAVAVMVFILRNPASHRAGAGLMIQTLLSLGVMGLILARYPSSSGFSATEHPKIPGSDEIVAALDAQTHSGDAILLLLYPEVSYVWLDIYDGSRPDTGLTIQSELDYEASQHLPRIERSHDRIWVVSTGTMSGNPENAVEQWVARRGYAGEETWYGDFRLIPYAFDAQGASLKPADNGFGDGTFALTGYAVDVVEREEIDWVSVWLRWEARREISGNYTVFIHLRDGGGQVVAQHDSWPVSAYAPTIGWTPGVPVDDRHLILLPGGLPPGDYDVFAGLYDSATGERIRQVGGEEDAWLCRIHLD